MGFTSEHRGLASIDLNAPSMKRLIKLSGKTPPVGASPGELRLWLKINGLLDHSTHHKEQVLHHMRHRATNQFMLEDKQSRSAPAGLLMGKNALPPIAREAPSDPANRVMGRKAMPSESESKVSMVGDATGKSAAGRRGRRVGRSGSVQAAAKERTALETGIVAHQPIQAHRSPLDEEVTAATLPAAEIAVEDGFESTGGVVVEGAHPSPMSAEAGLPPGYRVQGVELGTGGTSFAEPHPPESLLAQAGAPAAGGPYDVSAAQQQMQQAWYMYHYQVQQQQQQQQQAWYLQHIQQHQPQLALAPWYAQPQGLAHGPYRGQRVT